MVGYHLCQVRIFGGLQTSQGGQDVSCKDKTNSNLTKSVKYIPPETSTTESFSQFSRPGIFRSPSSLLRARLMVVNMFSWESEGRPAILLLETSSSLRLVRLLTLSGRAVSWLDFRTSEVR